MIEGVGINHITDNVAAAQVDTAYTIPDAEALPYVFANADKLSLWQAALRSTFMVQDQASMRLSEDLGPWLQEDDPILIGSGGDTTLPTPSLSNENRAHGTSGPAAALPPITVTNS